MNYSCLDFHSLLTDAQMAVCIPAWYPASPETNHRRSTKHSMHELSV